MSNEADIIICPSCQCHNTAEAYTCSECGSPLHQPQSLDPIQQAMQSEAEGLHQIIHSPRKPIVLIGTWVLFLPMLLAGVMMSVISREHFDLKDPESFKGTGMSLFFVLLPLYILIQSTRNFFKKSTPPQTPGETP